MTPEEARSKLKTNDYIRLSTARHTPGGNGYVGEVFENSFEFLVVTNPSEHFGNLSAPARTVTHVIPFEAIEAIESQI